MTFSKGVTDGCGDTQWLQRLETNPRSITLCDFPPTRMKDNPCERSAAIPLDFGSDNGGRTL